MTVGVIRVKNYQNILRVSHDLPDLRETAIRSGRTFNQSNAFRDWTERSQPHPQIRWNVYVQADDALAAKYLHEGRIEQERTTPRNARFDNKPGPGFEDDL